MKLPLPVCAIVLVVSHLASWTAAATPTPATTAPSTQRSSAFFPPAVLERVRANAQATDWGRGLRDQAVAQAAPWKAMSDEQLWRLMFGATIPRSWHVLSNG